MIATLLFKVVMFLSCFRVHKMKDQVLNVSVVLRCFQNHSIIISNTSNRDNTSGKENFVLHNLLPCG